MRYLILDANYRSTGIRDLDGNYLSQRELSISDKLWNEIQIWVDRYIYVVKMDDNERKINLDLIKILDTQGLGLCDKIISELKEEVKIEYFSEGLLKKILTNLSQEKK